MKNNVELNDQIGLIVPDFGQSEEQEFTGTVRVRLKCGREVAVRPNNLEIAEETRRTVSSKSQGGWPIPHEVASSKPVDTREIIKEVSSSSSKASIPVVLKAAPKEMGSTIKAVEKATSLAKLEVIADDEKLKPLEKKMPKPPTRPAPLPPTVNKKTRSPSRSPVRKRAKKKHK